MSPTKLKERSSGSSAPRSTAKEDAIATAATNLPSSTGSQRQSTADPSAMVKTESTTGLHPWSAGRISQPPFILHLADPLAPRILFSKFVNGEDEYLNRQFKIMNRIVKGP
ncbi:unnamed protein product [Linum tenue]|uniref:Uncharacterized protein n=1 Tax=Linum tenue TaxID=586396 RepID=A0AAV0NYF0_9ROSI|nr:unnamed protein product [Linum tenue]